MCVLHDDLCWPIDAVESAYKTLLSFICKSPKYLIYTISVVFLIEKKRFIEVLSLCNHSTDYFIPRTLLTFISIERTELPHLDRILVSTLNVQPHKLNKILENFSVFYVLQACQHSLLSLSLNLKVQHC
jgi:hypothetical protein